MPPKQNITPLGSRVLVRREMSPEKVGKILVPDTARKKVCRGVVLAAGEGEMPPGWTGRPMTKASGNVDEPSLVGRTVIISQYAGSSLPDDMNENDLLVVVNAEEILAVVG